MHILTIVHHELKTAGAWPAFAALDWKTRGQVLAVMHVHAGAALIEEDGHAAIAEQEVVLLTGSPLLGEMAGRCLRKWAARAG